MHARPCISLFPVLVICSLTVACVLWPGPLAAESFTLRPQQLTAELGIGYAVSLTDVNGDGRTSAADV